MAALFIVLLSKTHKASFIDIQDGKDPKITLIGSVILFLVAGTLLIYTIVGILTGILFIRCNIGFRDHFDAVELASDPHRVGT